MDKATSHTMRRGRLTRDPEQAIARINASVDFDRRLAPQDIAGSRAHCAMLMERGIISRDDGARILEGLDAIAGEVAAGEFRFNPALEDVHMNVEARLAELIGPAAGRLHTARSRNDQVATDMRLYVRDAISGLDARLAAWQGALLDLAEPNADAIMPGFTHMQSAQPITLGHHLLAYVEMIHRDRGRFADARRRLNLCPLGAAALAGTSFPIDRDMTAAALEFDAPTANSLDSVSDRDFVMETLAAAAITALHLSRFAEEIVLWCSDLAGFARLSDATTTGSSIMPQKRNPDAAELVRAKTGRIMGAFTALGVVLKGLPLAYSKDMQEDKEALFDALDTLSACLDAVIAMTADLAPNPATMRAAAARGFSTATDLADWLVRTLDMPFRQAHQVTGALVTRAEAAGVELADLSLEDMQAVEPRITARARPALDVEASVRSRTSFGGTAPDNVRAACAAWRQRLTAGQSRTP